MVVQYDAKAQGPFRPPDVLDFPFYMASSKLSQGCMCLPATPQDTMLHENTDCR